MWNYVPTISRMIKIPPSMMMQSWMGSDFTNDDLVKQSSIVVDYTHTILGKEVLRDQNCYLIELIPLPDAPVVWGKIKTWVTVDGFNIWKNEFYDEDGYLQTSQTITVAFNAIALEMYSCPSTKVPFNATKTSLDSTFLESNSIFEIITSELPITTSIATLYNMSFRFFTIILILFL